jgi:uncharacterized protein (DUF3084 family)
MAAKPLPVSMSGYLLLLVILLLGGGVATIGDRLGFKVGKARLSIFGLRPKYTAVIATFVTGVLVSAVTLGVIVLADSQIRVGLFKLGELQDDLARAQSLSLATQTKLQMTEQERRRAESQLSRINIELRRAQSQEKVTQTRLQQLQGKLSTVEQLAAKAQAQNRAALARAQTQVTRLQNEENRLTKRQRALQVNNQTLQQQLLAKRNELVELENTARELNITLASVLTGEVVIKRQQLLVTGIIRGRLTARQRQEALDRLFVQGEKTARALGAAPFYQTNRALVISSEQVQQILLALDSQADTIVQLRAEINVIKGKPVTVIASVLPNTLIFGAGSVMASREVVLPISNEVNIFAELFEQASQKARSKGLLPREDGKVGTFPQDAVAYEKLLQDLPRFKGQVTIQAITTRDIYTVGPLDLSLVILQDGKVLARVS